MMFCIKSLAGGRNLRSLNAFGQASYSRRSSNNSTSLYKVVNANGETLDDVNNSEFETSSNWELLTPRGFRFYLPGSIGPGWLNASTTSQVKTQFLAIQDSKEAKSLVQQKHKFKKLKEKATHVKPHQLNCVVQECPLLLRKSVEELFPGCIDVNSAQLTIVTLSQKCNLKTMKWSKEIETEKLAKYFVLAASNVCMKLKMIGYWADFINPFSGQPYFSSQKKGSLYATDERFRCLGFKVQEKNNCKIISCDNSITTFIGNLYTTAPASIQFLSRIMNDINTELE